MATPKIPVVKSWSFSRYSDYKNCPLKFKLKHLDKITEPPNDAMARGAEVHTKAEKYIKGELRTMPAELKLMADEAKALKAMYKKKLLGAIVEDSWALTVNWDQTVWNDWANCWVRIKLDAAHFEEDGDVMVVTDWKTGKFRMEKNEEYVEQLELYALAALLLHETVSRVYPRLAYVDQGVIFPEDRNTMVYTRADIPRLKKVWEKRVAPMFKDRKFAPRPNNLCRFCHFRASNKANGGGQCKF